MAKVLRLHQGTDTIEGWDNSSPYARNAIDQIQDPDGETSSREITSIPSPFARIDLVKTAFEKVCRSQKGLDSNTAFHKMVSDTLDVAELFFNLDKLRDKLEVIVWNKRNSLNSLINSTNKKHRQLGKTLELYLNQDTGYNFELLENIYLLNYKLGPAQMNIIGGTSPRTLFFTNANDLSYVDIRFGGDKIFDEDYRPLYKRDDSEFIKFLYALRSSDSNFRNYFKEVDDYLTSCFEYLPEGEKQIIRQFDSSTLWKKYKHLSVSGDNHNIEIIKNIFLGKSEIGVSVIKESDFILNSNAQIEDMPMVLPNSPFSLRLKYTTSTWDANFAAPYTDNRNLSERTLPHLTDNYPYLTVDDLLQPYLIQTVYSTDNKRFFNGNAEGFLENEGCILPLKKTYFDYFDGTDLKKIYNDGKRAFEIIKGKTSGVTVYLRLPIQGGNYVTFERTYYPSTDPDLRLPEIELDRNKGGLIKNTFGIAVFPNYRLQNQHSINHYQVAFYESDVLPYSINNDYHLEFGQFYNGSMVRIETEKAVQKSNKSTHAILSKYHSVNGNFDYIVVNDGNGHEGIVVPIFDEKLKGGREFKFAIDFGTTNTHIEYSVNGSDPLPFEIQENEIQIMALHDISLSDYELKEEIISGSGLKIIEYIDREFLPLLINKEFNRSFPQRTAVTHLSNLNFNTRIDPLLDINIPFFYEKISEHSGFDAFTNLKWSQYIEEGRNKKQVENFFAVLLMLIKNKVVINGGDLDKTEIIWFYPSSMNSHRRATLNQLWFELSETYISPNAKVTRLSESLAPFYYYRHRLNVTSSDRPVVSIDIGGGTTDVVVYQGNKANVLTSFKFAGNSLYGDGLNSNPSMNGFVQKYIGKYSEILRDNNLGSLKAVLENILKKNRSEDIISFFYSLEQNSRINNKVDFSFNKMLQNDRVLKPVILLFISSIIYHIAEVMKNASLDVPRYLIFSGTGSKVLNTLDPLRENDIMNEFIVEMFSQIYGKESGKIEIKKEENPKELTCKGGIFMESTDEVTLNEIRKVHIGDQNNSGNKEIRFKDINQELKDAIISNVKNFLEVFECVDRKISFTDKFGINAINHQELRNLILNDALSSINDGLEAKRREIENEDSALEETLFFYPLIKGINLYAYHNYDQSNTIHS